MLLRTFLCIALTMWFTPLAFAESSVSLKYPPDSLANWYRPANKRQVWLHSMFRLRRAMHALEDYVAIDNQAGMEKWSAKLEKDYLNIKEMVPEWSDRIKPELISNLNSAINAADKLLIQRSLKDIRDTCDNCHASFRPLVAALYRSPDFDEILVKKNKQETQGFVDAMDALPRSINRILIALEDQRQQDAVRSAQLLTQQINHLGESCHSCHKDNTPILRIMGPATQQRLDNLVLRLQNGQAKESRKLLGEIGVNVCSRCHSTHRTLSDLRDALSQ